MSDPITTAYRPGARALNYRSEPFMNRLERKELQGLARYNSYTFGDPSTPMPRAYLGDPTKIRIMHGGTEVFHVYHLHGGGIRWRLNPHADKTYDYEDTGLNKHPKTADVAVHRAWTRSPSARASPTTSRSRAAPAASSRRAGDFLFHCHIAEHYVGGHVELLARLRHQAARPRRCPTAPAPPPVGRLGRLIGKTMPDGTTLTKDNLDDWIKPQLPPQGVPRQRRGRHGVGLEGRRARTPTSPSTSASPRRRDRLGRTCRRATSAAACRATRA